MDATASNNTARPANPQNQAAQKRLQQTQAQVTI